MPFARGEGLLAKDGPLVVNTGKHTGRSAKDKFIVRDATSEDTVWWGKSNKPMDAGRVRPAPRRFPRRAGGQGHSCSSPTSTAARSPSTACSVRVINELAWHNLFIRTLLVRPEADELAGFVPEYHDHRPAELPRRSRAPRLPQRDGDRGQPRRRS